MLQVKYKDLKHKSSKIISKSKKKTSQENIFGIKNKKTKAVSVAQLDRVLASDAKGCEFEPRRIRQKISCKIQCFMVKDNTLNYFF